MQSLALFTVVCLVGLMFVLNLTIGRRNRKASNAQYAEMISELKEKAKEFFGESRFEGMVKKPFLSDAGNSYMLCIDKEMDLTAIVGFDGIAEMKYSEEKSCRIQVEGDDRNINSVRCTISCDSLENDLTITLGSRRHLRKGFIGRFILDNANEFKAFIEKGI